MPTIDPARSTLLLIDFQAKLMPAIDRADEAVANARRLQQAAALLGIPVLFTEQSAKGLGPTVAELGPVPGSVVHKETFNSALTAEFLPRLPADGEIVVCGCEAHVCVLQTVIGLLDAGRTVYVVRDALGARRPESKETAIERMRRHGAEIVTTEMVAFEWLVTAEHPRFREVLAIIK